MDSNVKYGPWIAHNGGECPVEDGAYGQIQTALESRVEVVQRGSHHQLKGLAWQETGDYAITAYRVLIEPELESEAVAAACRAALDARPYQYTPSIAAMDTLQSMMRAGIKAYLREAKIGGAA